MFRTSNKRRALSALSALVGLALFACEPQSQIPSEETRAAALENYAELVHAGYLDSLSAAREMRDAVRAFVSEPTSAGLEAARAAWLAAREPYGQTEAFRFYGGPIDDADGPEALINAWPLDEAYLDGVEGLPEAGIINDPASHPDISAESLVALNEAGAEENVSTGYHAVEFLLWGQDRSADGPGDRSHTDFVDGGTAPNPDRRRQALEVLADLLVQHLEELVADWEPNAEDNYRAQFLSQAPELSLQAVFTGIGVLAKSELAGERMFTAYDNRDQEDEHSCFSDNTHRDMITNAQGIANVLLGRYLRTDGSAVEGTSILDLVTAVDPEGAARLDELMQASQEAIAAIPVPFDRAIVEDDSRPLVLEAVYGLQDLGDQIAQSAAALGLSINTALPE